MERVSQVSLSHIKRAGRNWRWLLWLLGAVVVLVAGLLRWGGYILIANDPLPAHADAAVVLQGSLVAERARVAGAMALLQKGIAERVLLSVPPRSYWDEPIEPAVRRFLEREYGNELATKVDLCETGPDANSTRDEARDLTRCLLARRLSTVIIVTSDYHTRRAGLIWTKTLSEQAPTVHMWVHGVSDSEFQARGWWRSRLYSKTWFLESIKLVWSVVAE